MAPSAKTLSFLFLLFLISSLQIHARESEFFSKFTRDNKSSSDNKNAASKESELLESEDPSHTQDEQPTFTPQNHNSFGLYGHGSEQFSPNSVNDAYYTPTTFSEKTTTEQYTPENYQQKSFNRGYSTNNYNYNGYENKQQSSSDTRFMDTTSLNNNNNNNYNNYRYGTKQQGMKNSRYVDTAANLNNNYYNGNEMTKQGMSDTRFLENGKYFYDVNNEKAYHDRYHNQYETPKENHNGYSSYRGVQSRNRYNNGGYNGYSGNTYEYTNSMDGFQKQDEEFQESQEENGP